MHAYDASHRAKHHAQMGHAAQVSGIARLVGVQRTVQNNDNVKSTWLVKNLQHMLSTFELFHALLSLSGLLQWADLFAFFFSELPAIHLAPQNTYIAKGQLCCPRPYVVV